MGKTIDFAKARLEGEERQHELGADNRYDLHYWAAYLDGASAQLKEDMRIIEAERNKYKDLAIQVLKEKE